MAALQRIQKFIVISSGILASTSLTAVALAEGNSGSLALSPPLKKIELRLDGDIYIGGLAAGSVRLEAKVKNGTYEASAVSKSSGMTDYLVKWRGNTKAKGIISNGALRPTLHTRNDNSRWGKRSVRMDYGNGYQAPKVTLKEEGKKDPYRKRDKVPLAKTLETYDHLSGILAVMLNTGLSGKSACGTPVQFYDGKRRFDITLVPVGQDQLKKSKFSAYRGSALKCRMKITHIAGFSHKWIKEKKEARARGAKEDQVFVWVAPFKKGQVELPVKIEASNFLGVAFLHPTRIDIDKRTKIALRK